MVAVWEGLGLRRTEEGAIYPAIRTRWPPPGALKGDIDGKDSGDR